MRSLALLLAFAAGTAGAGTRDQYGYGWDLKMQPGNGAYRVVLDERVYARIASPDLRDLEVFDGQGQPVPFGPVPIERTTPRPGMAESRTEVPFFVLPRTSEAGADVLELHVVRDADGRLRNLDASVTPSEVQISDVVIDASALELAIDELELDWGSDSGDINARYAVSASDDFEHWYTVLPQVSLVDLKQGEFRLRRRAIDLPGGGADYLRLTRLDDGAPLALQRVTAVLRWTAVPSQPAPDRSWSNAKLLRTTEQPRAFEYQAPGPLPIERLAIGLAQVNSVARVAIFSRASPQSPWQHHGEITAFRVQAGDSAAENDDLALSLNRDREWRLVPSPPLASAPVLRLGWYPEAFALLAQGEGPYTLAAGSRAGRRDDYPMNLLLSELRAQFGRNWQLGPAQVGAEVALSGDAALAAPPKPKPYFTWVLWIVLVLGATSVIFMVFRLLRTPPGTAAG